MKKCVVGMVLLCGLLAGCQGKADQSPKEDSSVASSKSSEVISSTSESVESSSSSLESSEAASTSMETETSSLVEIIDTKNLTKAQVEDWIAAYIVNSTPQYKENGFTREDFGFAISPVTSGEISIRVEENHSTPKMRAAGADPATSPLVGNFQITNEGFLAKQDPVTLQSQVVATDYYTLH